MAKCYCTIVTTDALGSNALDHESWFNKRRYPRRITHVSLTGGTEGTGVIDLFVGDRKVASIAPSTVGAAGVPGKRDDYQAVHSFVPAGQEISTALRIVPSTNAMVLEIVTDP